MPEGWARDRRWQGTHLIHTAFGVVQFQEGTMEVVRHVGPAAEEDQGTGIVRQIPLEHFDVGFALGIKDNPWLESRVQCGPDMTSLLSLSPNPPPALFYTKPSPQLCHRDQRRCDMTTI